MRVLLWGLIVFLSALFFQFIIWRSSLPKKNHTIFLLKIFFGFFGLSLFFIFGFNIFKKPFEYLGFFILYSSVLLAYIVTYSAVEADSPSLLMVFKIAKSGLSGLSKEGLFNSMKCEEMIVSRLKALQSGGMISFAEGRYHLTVKGAFLVNIFIILRRMLKLNKGG
jgi:hypothetical protein